MNIRSPKWAAWMCFVLLWGVLAGCSRGGDGGGGEQIELVRVARGSLTVTITAVGTVKPRAELRLSFASGGEVQDVLVAAGERVQQGQTLARLDTSDLALQVQSAEATLAAAEAQLAQLEGGARPEEISIARANLAAAEARLAGARANLRGLTGEPDENQIAAAEANLHAAEASLWLAAVQREQIVDGAAGAEIAAAEAQLAAALVEQKVARDRYDQATRCETVKLPSGEEKEICPGLGTWEEQARFSLSAANEAVRAAQAQVDRLRAGPTQEQIDSGDANVAIAAAQREAAQAQLDLLNNTGPSEEQLDAAQANVDALTAQRDAAQAQLDLLLAGATTAERAALRASVAQAEVALQRARLVLEKGTLSAPFSGVVSRLDVLPGEFVGPQVPVLTLVDDERFHIEVEVDEADIGGVQVGQAVQLVLDAFPAQGLTGRVVAIATQATLETGVVSYQVTLETDQTALPLRGGMTVSAEIVAEQREGVLLVPNRAIWIDADTGQPFVERMRGEEIVGVIFEQGLANEEFSEVVSGLNEGDQLVVRSTSIRDRFREMMTRSLSGE